MTRFTADDTIDFRGQLFEGLRKEANDNGDQGTELMVRTLSFIRYRMHF